MLARMVEAFLAGARRRGELWCGASLLVALSCGQSSSEVEFSGFRVEEIGARRAVVRFDTDPDTRCEAEFGPSPGQLTRRATDPNMDPTDPYSFDHEVPLEDLVPDQAVFYRARVTTRGGLTERSEIRSFRTLPASVEGARDNLALPERGARVVAVSSNFGGAADDQPWGVLNALDGKMATEWSSHGDGDAAFVELDLGEARELGGFGYRSRQMADGTSIAVRVRLLFAADPGAAPSDVRGPFDTPDPSQFYEFSFEAPAVARRVRFEVVQSTGGNTGAREIQLFAP